MTCYVNGKRCELKWTGKSPHIVNAKSSPLLVYISSFNLKKSLYVKTKLIQDTIGYGKVKGLDQGLTMVVW